MNYRQSRKLFRTAIGCKLPVMKSWNSNKSGNMLWVNGGDCLSFRAHMLHYPLPFTACLQSNDGKLHI